MAKNKKSLFVVIEGVDGSGKTTLVRQLEEEFKKDQEIKNIFKKIVYSSEPAGGNLKFCQEIRNLILDNTYPINNKTRALLFMVNRSDHIEKLVEPTLSEENSLLICDRFYLSTLVYQGENNPKNIAWIKATQGFVTHINPDMTFFLEISDEVFLERYKKRRSNKKINILDEYIYQNFQRMSKSYVSFLESEKESMGQVIHLNGEEDTSILVQKVKQEIIKNYQ